MLYQHAPLQSETSDSIIPPWSHPAAPARDCHDGRILFDATATALDNDDDPRTALAMLSAGLRVARSFLPRDAWRAYGTELRAHRLGPMLCEDPITARSVARPRGYAGDAVLLDMIYAEPALAEALAQTTPLGRRLNAVAMVSPINNARRERRALLASRIDQAAIGAKPVILAIAAGHLREAEDSHAFRNGRIARWVALDQDAQSCAEIEARLGRRVETIPQSISAILKGEVRVKKVDFAYAAGLYDYLPAAVAIKLTRRVVAMLRPGGRYLFANYATGIWDAGFMEAVMDWNLKLRSPADMAQIADGVAGVTARHWSGVHGAVHYCELIKR